MLDREQAVCGPELHRARVPAGDRVRRGLMKEKGLRMRKLLLMAGLAGAAFIVANQRQDIGRYVKIKQMSLGEGHPENVPAGGTRQYPAPGQGAQDGTGDFDSARRGGPALAMR
jgi:hypothetical protein